MALMAALIILLFFLSGAASGLHLQTVNPGENVILTCDAADASIDVVEWTRDDLEPKYVLLVVDGHRQPHEQHPSFKGRVELVDRKMENGDASLVLKNVSSNDSGTYECRIKTAGSSHTKRAVLKGDPINSIQLEVTDSGKGDPETDDPKTDDPKTDDPKTDDPGNEDFTRGYVGLAAAGVLLLCFGIFFLAGYIKKHLDHRSERSAADEASVLHDVSLPLTS